MELNTEEFEKDLLKKKAHIENNIVWLESHSVDTGGLLGLIRSITIEQENDRLIKVGEDLHKLRARK